MTENSKSIALFDTNRSEIRGSIQNANQYVTGTQYYRNIYRRGTICGFAKDCSSLTVQEIHAEIGTIRSLGRTMDCREEASLIKKIRNLLRNLRFFSRRATRFCFYKNWNYWERGNTSEGRVLDPSRKTKNAEVTWLFLNNSSWYMLLTSKYFNIRLFRIRPC